MQTLNDHTVSLPFLLAEFQKYMQVIGYLLQSPGVQHHNIRMEWTAEED